MNNLSELRWLSLLSAVLCLAAALLLLLAALWR